MKVSVMCKKRVSDSAIFTYRYDSSKPSLARAKRELIDYHQFMKYTSGNFANFEKLYGFAIEQCVDPDSEFYILPAIVEAFKKSHDWGVAIVEVMAVLKEKYPTHISCSKLYEHIEERYDFDAPTLTLIRNCIEVASENSIDTTALRERLLVLFDGVIDANLINRVTFER